jgi:hypothetical protein
MKKLGDVRIAGSKTVDDWIALRKELIVGGILSKWEEAFSAYFYERLFTRYLEPIRTLQNNKMLQGEGFAIMSVQCSLIEFLASTIKGCNYRYPRKGTPPPGPHEYSNSSQLFVDFLTQTLPFSKDFSKDLARDFYEGVRCGLLHEARTKNGWMIWANGPKGTVVDRNEKIVYRNNFQDALLEFVTRYKGALASEIPLQKAFIRKFNSLCQ